MNSKFVFFGSDDTAILALHHLEGRGLVPSLIVDKKVDPETVEQIRALGSTFAILMSYGDIVKQSTIELFPKGILNIHPSILPKLRGASPIKSAILENLSATGTSIMLLDTELDHGPILIQEEVALSPQVASDEELKSTLLAKGAELIVRVLPSWLEGELLPTEQDHSLATFTHKFSTADAEIASKVIMGQAALHEVELAERKVRALNPEPGAFTLLTTVNKKGNRSNIRLKLLGAVIEDSKLVPTLVQPAGKKPMSWTSFLLGNKLAT